MAIGHLSVLSGKVSVQVVSPLLFRGAQAMWKVTSQQVSVLFEQVSVLSQTRNGIYSERKV